MEEMRFLLSAAYTRKIKSDDQLSYKATRNRFGLMCWSRLKFSDFLKQLDAIVLVVVISARITFNLSPKVSPHV